MTTVRMLQQMSGTRNGVPWPEVGEFLDVSEEEAQSLTSGQTPIAVMQKRPEAGPPDPTAGTLDAGAVTEPEATEPAAPVADTLAKPGPAATAAAKAKAAAPRPRTSTVGKK